MKRERYKGYVLVAKADKVRGQRIWTARVFIERFITGGWQDIPIPGLEGQQFDGEVNTQSAALSHGRHYVDGILPQDSRASESATLTSVVTARLRAFSSGLAYVELDEINGLRNNGEIPKWQVI